MAELPTYPRLPLNCTRLVPYSDVASANAVPRSSALPVVKDSPSLAETFTSAVVSENIEPEGRVDALEETGSRRSTGRVDWEERSTHFQSSLISVPRAGPDETRSMV